MAILHILCGNVGTGKTTTSNSLRDEKTLYVSEDLLAPLMSEGKYDQSVWTKPHFKVYRKLKLSAVEAALSNGFDLILDGTNIAVENRAKYIDVAKRYNATIICYVLTDSKYGLKNRKIHNRGTSDEVWEKVHDDLERKFEMPTRDEGIDKVIVIDSHPPVKVK